jgi:hypothetical protein
MAWRGREGGRRGRLWWTGRADADDVGWWVVPSVVVD